MLIQCIKQNFRLYLYLILFLLELSSAPIKSAQTEVIEQTPITNFVPVIRGIEEREEATDTKDYEDAAISDGDDEIDYDELKLTQQKLYREKQQEFNQVDDKLYQQQKELFSLWIKQERRTPLAQTSTEEIQLLKTAEKKVVLTALDLEKIALEIDEIKLYLAEIELIQATNEEHKNAAYRNYFEKEVMQRATPRKHLFIPPLPLIINNLELNTLRDKLNHLLLQMQFDQIKKDHKKPSISTSLTRESDFIKASIFDIKTFIKKLLIFHPETQEFKKTTASILEYAQKTLEQIELNDLNNRFGAQANSSRDDLRSLYQESIEKQDFLRKLKFKLEAILGMNNEEPLWSFGFKKPEMKEIIQLPGGIQQSPDNIPDNDDDSAPEPEPNSDDSLRSLLQETKAKQSRTSTKTSTDKGS